MDGVAGTRAGPSERLVDSQGSQPPVRLVECFDVGEVGQGHGSHRLTPFHDSGPLLVQEWQELRDHFDDEEMAELLICASVLAGVGRMLCLGSLAFFPN